MQVHGLEARATLTSSCGTGFQPVNPQTAKMRYRNYEIQYLDYGRADRGSEILNTPANSRSGELRCHRFRSHGCTVGIPEKWLVMEHLIHTAGRFYE